jgi:anthranilate synthase component 2
MLLMIDNYDSFTYNLVQYFGELGVQVKVYRNDQIEIEEISKMAPQYIVISPGPCTPNQAGISKKVVRAFAGIVPLLGVCLGHQCIGAAYGGSIIKAHQIMHGKTSLIYHQGTGLFEGLPNPFTATRYHSLVIDRDPLPKSLSLTAWTQSPDGSIEEIMGVQHEKHPIVGVQFHPESFLSEQGHALLRNFLNIKLSEK